MPDRELKFRAWDKREAKYLVVGFHIIGEVTVFDMLNHQPDHSLERLNDLVIEQFTGLYDKNGKEIYESDLVKISLGSASMVCIVAWSNVDAGWAVRGEKYDTFSLIRGYCKPDMTIEVIGNIHESPELLEK